MHLRSSGLTMREEGGEETRVQCPVGTCTRALEFGKRILRMQASPVTGFGPCGLEAWPEALELGNCSREAALGSPGMHWGRLTLWAES